MKMSHLVCVVLVSHAPFALAGSPDAPGQNGATVNTARDYWQSDKGNNHPNGWGQEVRAESQGYGPLGAGKLGRFLRNGPLTTDGRPNPENDRGRGND